MRNQQRANTSGPGRGWTRALLAATALTLGVLLPGRAEATGQGGNGQSSPGVGTDRGGDDETIGTLPILGNRGHLDFVRMMRDVRPTFFLEGNFDEILSVIVGCDGVGRVSVEALADGRSRLRFHGRIEVQLDRQLMQAAGVELGASIPSTFRGARAWSGWAGQLTPAGTLAAGNLALPVSVLDARDSIQGHPWVLAARSARQGNYRFQAWTDAGLLHIGQTY